MTEVLEGKQKAKNEFKVILLIVAAAYLSLFLLAGQTPTQ